MFNNIGTTELIILAIILLLLFGGKKLPELSRGVTQAVKEFRKGFDNDDNQK